MTNLNLDDKKTILRKIPSGLYIVTGMDDNVPSAAVVSFLTQSSIDPPLITMALREGSAIYHTVKKTKKCAIHFPAKDQQSLVASFFKIKTKDSKTINKHEYEIGEKGNPLLKNIPMILEVDVREESTIGDHHVFICEVADTILRSDEDALLMMHTNWKYGG
ncbi:MAG: flavin reductase [Candidatus Marinimicrobia bacterium]|nr:flavin reductase [Candidatus Neomarinimicrobiota bacterium]